VTARLHHARLKASIQDVLDAGFELLPHFELAAVTVMNGIEHPAEWPEIRRRLKAEGIRCVRHRGELDQIASVGMFEGGDELALGAEWNDEFEPFPGRLTGDAIDFNVDIPLGLEEWMVDSGCLLVLGDGRGLNFATPDAELAAKLQAKFKPAKD
jgi:hypothetical protein